MSSLFISSLNSSKLQTIQGLHPNQHINHNDFFFNFPFLFSFFWEGGVFETLSQQVQ